MTTYSIDIECAGPDPEVTKVTNGDKVTFNNKTGASVTITFGNSGVFNPSPGSSIDIDKDDSDTLTIGKIKNGTSFSYPECGEPVATRSGRIDPK